MEEQNKYFGLTEDEFDEKVQKIMLEKSLDYRKAFSLFLEQEKLKEESQKMGELNSRIDANYKLDHSNELKNSEIESHCYRMAQEKFEGQPPEKIFECFSQLYDIALNHSPANADFANSKCDNLQQLKEYKLDLDSQ